MLSRLGRWAVSERQGPALLSVGLQGLNAGVFQQIAITNSYARFELTVSRRFLTPTTPIRISHQHLAREAGVINAVREIQASGTRAGVFFWSGEP